VYLAELNRRIEWGFVLFIDSVSILDIGNCWIGLSPSPAQRGRDAEEPGFPLSFA